MSDDAKLASVLRCLSGQLKTQAMIHVTESSMYNDLRRLIERWENGQARWNDALANSHPTADANDTSAPMQIDRVKDEGKRRRPIRQGSGKCAKGKGKGHAAPGKVKGAKAKGKGKGQDAGGKGAKVCNFCKRPGHFKRDSYAFMSQQKAQGYVQKLEQGNAPGSSASASVSSAAQPGQVNKGRVNRLEFGISFAEEESMLALEEIGLTGVSVGEEHGTFRMVRSMDPKGFDMSRADEDSDWLNDLSPRLNLLAWPSVSLVGLDQNSDSCPLNCGDPTSTTSESQSQPHVPVFKQMPGLAQKLHAYVKPKVGSTA